MVREIDNQIAVSLPTVITTALSRAKVLLDDLDQLMQVKLLKSADDSIRTRRRAWAQNKSKINRVKSELNEQRINLIAAISASSLSVPKLQNFFLRVLKFFIGSPFINLKQRWYPSAVMLAFLKRLRRGLKHSFRTYSKQYQQHSTLSQPRPLL